MQFLVPKLQNSNDVKIKPKQTGDVFNPNIFNEHMRRAPDVKEALIADGDPFSILVGGMKALVFAMVASCTAAVLYGAYDSGYRRTLRTSFPWGAQLLDLVKEEEGPSTIDEDESGKSASEFRKTYAK